MDRLELNLARLGELPLDPRLDGIDDAVMAAVARHGRESASLRSLGLVGVLSLGLGLASSLVPSSPPRAPTAFPLGAPASLAPSTLLAASE